MANGKMTWSNADACEALARYEAIVRMTAARLRPVATLGQALDEDDLCAEGRVAVLEALSTYQGFGIEERTATGVRGRRSDNRLIEAKLDWRPTEMLRMGLERTYGWIEDQVHGQQKQSPALTPELTPHANGSTREERQHASA